MASEQKNFEISLSESAAKRISFLTQQGEDKGKKLRISVLGGGCSGFQYKYELVDTIESDDIIIKNDGATLIIDQVSADLLKGSVVNYIESLGFAHFEIKNPNAASKCGCGNSFSI